MATFGDFEALLRGLPRKLSARGQEALQRTANRVIEDIREHAPRKSGAGAAAITARRQRWRIEIGGPKYMVLWQERGTGIYGPFGTVIRPVVANALRFEWRGAIWIRKWVRGTRGKRFIEKAMAKSPRIFADEWKQAVRRAFQTTGMR